jgi:hypothetical protein
MAGMGMGSEGNLRCTGVSIESCGVPADAKAAMEFNSAKTEFLSASGSTFL